MTPKIPRIVTGTLRVAEPKRKNSFNLHFDDLPIEFICNPKKWKEDAIPKKNKKGTI